MMVLTDPHGVIFVANHREWLYHVLWKLSSEKLKTISETRQFGNGPWKWTGLENLDGRRAVDKSNSEYSTHEAKIVNYPGWKVVYLHDPGSDIKKISGLFFKSAGFLILVVCILAGLVVMNLYRTASRDLAMRRKAEESLKDSRQTSIEIVDAIPSGLFIYQFEPPDKLVLLIGKRFTKIFPVALR